MGDLLLCASVEGGGRHAAQVYDEGEDLIGWDLADDFAGFGAKEGDDGLAGEVVEAEAGL